MRQLLIGLVVASGFSACTKEANVKPPAKEKTDVMFSFDGKDFSKQDLPEEVQVSIYQAEERMRREVDAAIDSYLLKNYVQIEAAKQNKTPDEIQKEALEPKEPSEAELKAFYDQKKDRIPYPFETVKDEIKKVISQDRRFAARTDLLQKIKDGGKFNWKIPQAVEPLVTVKSEGFPGKGSTTAKVQVVEFADFLCPHCYEAFLALKAYWPDVQEKVGFTFMFYPLNAAEDSLNYIMARGGFCAHKQQKFWEFHDLAFASQRVLGPESPMKFAKDLKLDTDAYAKCLADKATTAAIAASRQEGDRIGVKATPVFFVNGKRVEAEMGLVSLRKAVEDAKD